MAWDGRGRCVGYRLPTARDPEHGRLAVVVDFESGRRILLDRDRGSAIVEGLIGLGIAFLLLVLVVQAGMLLMARNAAEAAVGASARSASQAGADLAAEESSLISMLEGTVPGSSEIAVTIQVNESTVDVAATFRWTPPGPNWATVPMEVRAKSPLVQPP